MVASRLVAAQLDSAGILENQANLSLMREGPPGPRLFGQAEGF
jgi:hypothetical protein